MNGSVSLVLPSAGSIFLLSLSKLYRSTEYQKEPAIVRMHPIMLLIDRDWWNKTTEIRIMHTCFTFPVMLITSGEVDRVASKLEIFNENAVNPWKRRRAYTKIV